MKDQNLNDIIETAIEDIHCDEKTRIRTSFYVIDRTTQCTIIYIKNGEIKVKTGYSIRRKGEKEDPEVGMINSLIRASRERGC